MKGIVKLEIICINVFLLLVLVNEKAIAQQTWAHAYGGANSDYAQAIQQTSDGGYIVAGNTISWNGTYDWLVLKLDSNGSIVWQKTYGRSTDDECRSVQQTSDGGYILAGYTNSLATSTDVWILKLNSNGDIAWQKTYGGSFSDSANYIQQTSDGGYAIAAGTTSYGAGGVDILILKLDANGEMIWQKTYGGSGEDTARSIQQTSDGGYIVSGSTSSFGAGIYDVWILKLNSNGDVVWQKTYGGSSSEFALSAQQISDGGYIIAAYTLSYGAGGVDILILKLDANGEVIWQKTYGGSGNDFLNSLQQTSDGGYIIAGYTKSYGAGSDDYFILKLNSDGTMDTSCTFVNNAYIIPVNASAAITDTNASISSPSLTIADTGILGINSSASDTIICYSCIAPTGFTNNSATDLDGCTITGVEIIWPANPVIWGDKGIGTRTYDVLRNGLAIVLGLSYGTTNYIDTSGLNGITYTYSIRYNNGCFLSSSTAGSSAANNGFPPSNLTNNAAIDINSCMDTGVRITWNADPGNWGDGGIGTRTYDVIRSGMFIAAGLSYGVTIYTDISGTNGINYLYRIRYNNGCGISANTIGIIAADNFDTTPCPDVGNTLLISKSGAYAVITWAASACSDLANYRIFGTPYYDDPFPSIWDILGNPSATSLNDLLSSYYVAYKALAVDACGNISTN